MHAQAISDTSAKTGFAGSALFYGLRKRQTRSMLHHLAHALPLQHAGSGSQSPIRTCAVSLAASSGEAAIRLRRICDRSMQRKHS
jgi:hypothetical protein